jgi:hypothetical protein
MFVWLSVSCWFGNGKVVIVCVIEKYLYLCRGVV